MVPLVPAVPVVVAQGLAWCVVALFDVTQSLGDLFPRCGASFHAEDLWDSCGCGMPVAGIGVESGFTVPQCDEASDLTLVQFGFAGQLNSHLAGCAGAAIHFRFRCGDGGNRTRVPHHAHMGPCGEGETFRPRS